MSRTKPKALEDVREAVQAALNAEQYDMVIELCSGIESTAPNIAEGKTARAEFEKRWKEQYLLLQEDRAEAAAELGLHLEVIDAANILCAAFPTDSNHFLNLAKALRRVHRLDDAKTIAEYANDLSPNGLSEAKTLLKTISTDLRINPGKGKRLPEALKNVPIPNVEELREKYDIAVIPQSPRSPRGGGGGSSSSAVNDIVEESEARANTLRALTATLTPRTANSPKRDRDGNFPETTTIVKPRAPVPRLALGTAKAEPPNSGAETTEASAEVREPTNSPAKEEKEPSALSKLEAVRSPTGTRRAGSASPTGTASPLRQRREGSPHPARSFFSEEQERPVPQLFSLLPKNIRNMWAERQQTAQQIGEWLPPFLPLLAYFFHCLQGSLLAVFCTVLLVLFSHNVFRTQEQEDRAVQRWGGIPLSVFSSFALMLAFRG